MPRVPTYDDFQVQAGTLASVRLQSADVPDVAGQQLQQLGQQASAAGGQLGKIALDMQQQANQVRVNDAINQVKEEQLRLTYDKDAGFTALKGINALQRPDGKPLAEEYTGTLQKRITALAATLGNDAQRASFMQQTGGLLAAFRGGILQHEAGEFKAYSLSVADGIIATAQRDIGLNFANPEVTGAAIERIKAETYRQAQLLGKSAEWQDAAVRQAESGAHKLAVNAALEQGDAQLAQQYLSQHKDGMAADDLFQARKGVDDLLGLQLARQRVGEAFESGVAQAQRVSANTALGGSFARMVQITLQAESGGRRWGADGALLQSSAGAKGEMQVLDSTNANPGFGVRAAVHDSPDERARVGRDYLGALLQRYEGDPAKAWVAYNWGPGALDAALKQHGENWLAAAPAETRAYVAKNLQALGGNKLVGTGENAAPVRFDLAAAERRLLQDPQLARNPKLQEAALRQLQHQAKTFQDGVQQQEQQAVANAMRGVIENGGSFDALPLALRQNLPPDKLPELLRYAKAVSEAGEPTTDVNKWLEFTNLPLKKMAALTPDALLAGYRAYFSDADLRKADQMIQGARGELGKGPAGGEGLQLLSSADLLKRSAIELKILPASGKVDEAHQAQYLAFTDRMQQQVSAWEAAHGKKASPEVLRQLLDQEKLNLVRYDEWGRDQDHPLIALKADDVKRAYTVVGGEEIALASIPRGQRVQIVQALQQAGLPVTEQAVAELWVRGGRKRASPASDALFNQIPTK